MSKTTSTFTFRRAPGDNWIWGSGAALASVLLMVLLLLGVILFNGLGFFWPDDVVAYELKDGSTIAGSVAGRETVELEDEVNGVMQTRAVKRIKIHAGNRELRQEFVWIDEDQIVATSYPEDFVVMERLEYGMFYGELQELKLPNLKVEGETNGIAGFKNALDAIKDSFVEVLELQDSNSKLNDKIGRALDKRMRLAYKGVPADAPAMVALHEEVEELKAKVDTQKARMVDRELELKKNVAVFKTGSGRIKEIPLQFIVREYQPNRMGIPAKTGFYLSKIKEMMTENPREANTEGGLFPAIYGTVLLVVLMSIFCMPVGIVAAIYLREYAKEGTVVRLVRIAVNNLAGVPSIVYGVFGLGFFVYKVGAGIDKVFYPHLVAANQSKFGTEGLLWASLTLALLTVPVVIVATEEALAAIPRGMREGSLALGATKWQTVRSVLLPMASPGILTGFILSMARAAGEVAPLMLTGVIKLTEELPLDGTFPYLHAERKFMHLGFHIFDMGFKSPNVEAALPMVYVTTVLLLLIVIALNIFAISLRNRMRKKYSMGAF